MRNPGSANRCHRRAHTRRRLVHIPTRNVPGTPLYHYVGADMVHVRLSNTRLPPMKSRCTPPRLVRLSSPRVPAPSSQNHGEDRQNEPADDQHDIKGYQQASPEFASQRVVAQMVLTDRHECRQTGSFSCRPIHPYPNNSLTFSLCRISDYRTCAYHRASFVGPHLLREGPAMIVGRHRLKQPGQIHNSQLTMLRTM